MPHRTTITLVVLIAAATTFGAGPASRPTTVSALAAAEEALARAESALDSAIRGVPGRFDASDQAKALSSRIAELEERLGTAKEADIALLQYEIRGLEGKRNEGRDKAAETDVLVKKAEADVDAARLAVAREWKHDGVPSVIFVVQASSAMMIDWEQVQKALRQQINALAPEYEFQILFFQARAIISPWRGAPRRATSANKKLAIDLIDQNLVTGTAGSASALSRAGGLRNDLHP